MSSSLAGERADTAFERLYRRHRGDVYRFILRDVRNPEEAEDVTQTAFLNAYRALQHGDAPEKPRAWLLTIAQNVARRRFRARSVRPQEVELNPETAVAPAVEGPSAGEIREALLRLRPNHRVVIVLREIGGLSYSEIAEKLGVSVSAVETLLFRARRALRDELSAPEERRGRRVGGILLPTPAAFSDLLGSVAGWFGRRVAVAKIAGATGAAVIGTGLAVQTGAVALPGASSDPGVREEPAAVVVGKGPKADTLPARAEKTTKAERRRADSRAASSKTRAGGATEGTTVLGVQVPAGGLPDVAVPGVNVGGVEVPGVEVEVPGVEVEVPGVEVEVPAVEVPEVGLVPAPEVEAPAVELPPVPQVEVPPVPEVDVPPLPNAGDLVP